MELPSFLVTLAPYLFFGLIVGFLIFWLFAVFTKRGRNIGPEVVFGCKVIENFGVIANNSIPLGSQKLTLLGCEKDGEKFLVLEIRTNTMASINVNWARVDDRALEAINQIVKTI